MRKSEVSEVMDLTGPMMNASNMWAGRTFLGLDIISLCHFHSDVIFFIPRIVSKSMVS
jgi:hypothetical protein